MSPAYDLNPNPHRPDRLSTAIDLDDTNADIETALSVSGYFRLTQADARSEITTVSEATRNVDVVLWRSEAVKWHPGKRGYTEMTFLFPGDSIRSHNTETLVPPGVFRGDS